MPPPNYWYTLLTILAMTELSKTKAKAVGVSNFTINHVRYIPLQPKQKKIRP